MSSQREGAAMHTIGITIVATMGASGQGTATEQSRESLEGFPIQRNRNGVLLHILLLIFSAMNRVPGFHTKTRGERRHYRPSQEKAQASVWCRSGVDWPSGIQ
jgi:hypothetical protein